MPSFSFCRAMSLKSNKLQSSEFETYRSILVVCEDCRKRKNAGIFHFLDIAFFLVESRNFLTFVRSKCTDTQKPGWRNR